MRPDLQNIPHIERWLEGRSFLIALLAPLATASLNDFSHAFSQLKARRLGDHQYPLPHLPAWFRLYRSHRKTETFIKGMFSEFLASGSEYVELAENIMVDLRHRKRGKVDPRQPLPSSEEISAANEYIQKILADFSQDLDRDFSAETLDPAEREAFKRFNKGKELVASFFMLVQVPCWLLFQTSPTELYRQARLGNLDALDKLLRLDPLMLHDPMIGKQLLKVRYEGKSSTYRSLLESPLKSPGKFSQKSLKAGMAGFLSALAAALGQPLTEPEIKRLFDAVAKDRTKDPHAIDESIPDTPESFAKAIRRKRQPWVNAMNPDKKI